MRATIYNASAGSGKTYTLAYKYVRDVIERPSLYRNILAVTFTNKATEEMKRRILSEIHALAAGDPSNYIDRLQSELGKSEEQVRRNALEVRTSILHDYSRFTILTIDRFFQRIIRAFVQELGLDLNYNIELDPSVILTQSADRIIEQIGENEELKKWIAEFVEERIEDGKSWDIQDGILSLSGEIFKESNYESLENPASKERLKEIIDSYITRSQARRQELVKIGKQAQEIITKAGLTTESFSGKSRSFAKYFDQIASELIKEPTATQRTKAESIDGWGKGLDATSMQLQPLLSEAISIYDDSIKLWNTTAILRENYRSFALLSDLYSMVKVVSSEQNMMLLSETKLILSQFIEGNDAPFIYEKVGNRFERYMIDEFQDTSLKEWNNFLPLLENAMSQSDANSVLIVGDIKQSIYRWRGGDWRILHSKAIEGLGTDCTEVVNLQENYRSLPNIVEFNNAIIECVVKNDNDNLHNKLTEAGDAISAGALRELDSLLVQAYSDHNQIPRKRAEVDGYVDITIHNDEPDFIGRIEEVLDKGFSPSQILILTRSNNEGVRIASALLEHKSHSKHHFDVMTQEALIVGTAPISQFIVASLKLALDPLDDISRAIYNRYLGQRALNEELCDSDKELLLHCRSLSTEEAFESIVIAHQLNERASEVAYLQAMHESICNFCTSKSGDISLFLKWWEEHGAKRSISVEQSEHSIEITTIHKAKGLEKAVVIIPYCTWNLDPKSSGAARTAGSKPQSGSAVWATAQNELSEIGAFPVKYKKSMGQSHFSEQYYREAVYAHIDNINMLYVALTRASQALHIFIKSGRPGVGSAISDAIKPAGDEFSIGSLKGKAFTSDEVLRYTIGDFAPPIKEKSKIDSERLYKMKQYPTSNADLRLRLPSERYFEEQAPGENISARSQGVLMHKAFAESSTREEIFANLNTMELNGQISPAEHAELTALLERELEKPIIKEWFTTEWEAVRNEQDIIIPRSLHFKRPDRVMTLGDKAIVVDYKFGAIESQSHKSQVATYMHLLAQMGYTDIKGYLWYIRNGKVVEI